MLPKSDVSYFVDSPWKAFSEEWMGRWAGRQVKETGGGSRNGDNYVK